VISRRRQLTLAIVLIAACATGAAVVMKLRDARSFADPHRLLSRFPVEDATVLRIDFSALRRGGFLTASKSPLEPEYRQFLEGTGFDYRRDLDLLVASFSKSGNYFIAEGRFDWNKLRDYAARQGGSCYEDLCRMPGSTPQRHISFLPLRSGVLALAVSTDDLAVSHLAKEGAPVTAQLPDAPAWISVPGAALREPGVFPPGLHLMLSALTNADRVVVTLGPQGQGIEAHMNATCRTPDDARVLASQLRSTTSLLKEGMAANKQVQSDDLARMLVAGRFDQTDKLVAGQWPVDKSLLDSLTDGI